MLITGVRFNKISYHKTCGWVLSHTYILWNFLSTVKAPACWKALDKTFSYLPLRPGLAVTIWTLIADEDQHLCDDCFVLYPSLE